MDTAHKQVKVLVIFYSQSGVTRRIAEILQSKTQADLYEIETVRTYPTQQPGIYDEPKKELETGQLPALKHEPPDMSAYDLILVGGPVWWYTVSTPVMRFLQLADFKGKKTAAFCTHMGGLGRYFPHFRTQARHANVLEGIDFFQPTRSKTASTEAALDKWLDKLANS
ncbi:MAG: NAD(P)H-dependent oxidoreductase [Alistipes senegalensis]|nr:NAD(P)H-dependent oxidoreductase [Oxalobacter formigenes]MCM1281035.1 NAD(P)H-dependent oxidoreductase [Alistipes senegalensis]